VFWDEFRDISEYKTAFSECRPQSRPDNRPWLETHLDSSANPIYPSSVPTSSLFHRFDPLGLPTVEVFRREGNQNLEQLGDPEKSSPYFSEFRHSTSLDFGILDIDAL
jgi:hypothetical protein